MTIQDNAAPLILFVDDEATAVKYFGQALESVATVAAAGSVEEGRRLLDEYAQSLLVLVTDQRMPGGYGNELLHYAKDHYPHMVRILTTAYSELDNTIEAVNQGQIHHYISKPWEMDALRMEMRQALALARLQKEHQQLLREKMAVRQQQVVSSRIGELCALCVTLTGKEDFSPLESYLTAVEMASIEPYEPDWLHMDYAELVAAEASRNGRFGHKVNKQLAGLRQQFGAWQPGGGLAPLLDALGGKVQLGGDGTVSFPDAKFLTEFTGAASDAAPSAQHAAWLALLLFLQERGCVLRLGKAGDGVCGSLETAPAQISAERLEYWVGRL